MGVSERFAGCQVSVGHKRTVETVDSAHGGRLRLRLDSEAVQWGGGLACLVGNQRRRTAATGNGKPPRGELTIAVRKAHGYRSPLLYALGLVRPDTVHRLRLRGVVAKQRCSRRSPVRYLPCSNTRSRCIPDGSAHTRTRRCAVRGKGGDMPDVIVPDGNVRPAYGLTDSREWRIVMLILWDRGSDWNRLCARDAGSRCEAAGRGSSQVRGCPGNAAYTVVFLCTCLGRWPACGFFGTDRFTPTSTTSFQASDETRTAVI